MAIVELTQVMDHHDISNTVDSTHVFQVVEQQLVMFKHLIFQESWHVIVIILMNMPFTIFVIIVILTRT
jgi:hypothetical protein